MCQKRTKSSHASISPHEHPLSLYCLPWRQSGSGLYAGCQNQTVCTHECTPFPRLSAFPTPHLFLPPRHREILSLCPALSALLFVQVSFQQIMSQHMYVDGQGQGRGMGHGEARVGRYVNGEFTLRVSVSLSSVYCGCKY